MEKLIKIDATVVSHSGGVHSGNGDNFFINGRYMYEHERENNIQVSIYNEEEEHFYAVSVGMDKTNIEKGTSISMMKELKKFQEKIRGTGGEPASKFVQLKDKVEEVNNIIYSMSIGSQEIREKGTAFAGFFILEGKGAVLSSGRSKVFLQRGDTVKLLTGESKKAERLLKMGIITNEQASVLTGKIAVGSETSGTGLHKADLIEIKHGDVFLICNDGITNTLEDEKIHEILSVNRETGYIANLLIKEALRKGEKDNITVLIVKVRDINSENRLLEKMENPASRKRYKQVEKKKNENFRTIVSAVIACIIIIGILSAVFYNTWVPEKDKIIAQGSSTKVEETNVPEPLQNENQPTTAEQKSDEAIEDKVEDKDNDTNQQQKPQDESSPVENVDNDEETKHIVKSGDNLEDISKKYYGRRDKYKLIMEKNGITNPNSLKVGDELIIPKE